jgi:hypothetical protein
MTRNHGEERTPWSRRPHYTPRQKLTAEQLNGGLNDQIKRQRILNRALHGYGVVMGYGLTVLDDAKLDIRHGQIEILDGVALDRSGRMLVWQRGRIGMEDLVGARPKKAGQYTLIAHYAVRSPEKDACAPSGGGQLSWTEEGVVFSLRPGLKATNRGCPRHPPNRRVSHGEYLNRRNGGLPGHFPTVAASPDVAWLAETPDAPCTPYGRGWAFDPDPRVGVPLACVEICDLTGGGEDQDGGKEHDSDDCEPRWGFCPGTEPDTVRVRPLVYRNPLLYELTRCCDVDLPRVSAVSWQDWVDQGWQEPIPWEDFADVVARSAGGFGVKFSKPIDPATLHEGSIFATVFYQDDDAAWRNYRIPLAKLVPVEKHGMVVGAQLIPDRDEWVPSEVRGKRSNLFQGVRIEITIRGQLIRDKRGRMLDARPMKLECGARCQSRPGDDFVSVFQVGAHHPDQYVPSPVQHETTTDQQVTKEAGE